MLESEAVEAIIVHLEDQEVQEAEELVEHIQELMGNQEQQIEVEVVEAAHQTVFKEDQEVLEL
jgi:hypothetical protein